MHFGDHRGVITRFYLNYIKCLRPNRSAFGFLNRNLIMPVLCVNVHTGCPKKDGQLLVDSENLLHPGDNSPKYNKEDGADIQKKFFLYIRFTR